MKQAVHKRMVSLVKYNKVFLSAYRCCGNLLAGLLRAAVRTKKKRILFMSFGGQKYDDSPKVLYERMKEDPFFRGYEMVWAFTEPERFADVSCKKVKVDTPKFYYTAVSAGIWVTNSSVDRGLRLKKKNCIEINTWHGTPIKKLGGDVASGNSFKSFAGGKPYSGFPTTYCAQSEYDRDIFTRFFRTGKEHILLSDLPRNDPLLRYTPEQTESIRRNLQLPANKKVLLYAPTFREFARDNFNACYLKPPIDIEKWRKTLGDQYVVLFRAHYEVIHVLGIKDSSFIKNVSAYPCLNDLIAVSDLLISDYSSLYFDYSITGKPMFCFAYDYDEYLKKRGLYLELASVLPCRINMDEDQLLEELCHYDRAAYCAGTRAFKARFAPYAGNAAETVVQTLKKLVLQRENQTTEREQAMSNERQKNGEMKALILAAGMGTRLAPITDTRPKSLVPVNGKPILIKQIENLYMNGVTDITVVSGYKADILKETVHAVYPAVKIMESVDYAATNNMFSAYLARRELAGKAFLMMNADVFFDASVISALLRFNWPDAIVTDIGTYYEESMKVVERDGRLVEISKAVPREASLGASIDVYKFSPTGGQAFFAKCEEYIEGKKELKKWSEVALNEILPDVEFRACPLEGRWVEIDNHEDLKAAERLFADGAPAVAEYPQEKPEKLPYGGVTRKLIFLSAASFDEEEAA